MAVNLSALAGAGQQFFDNNGNPLSGGKLWSYQAGTTTPQTTYTTASGNVAHTNPIILDSAGRVATGQIWLTLGSNYKFTLMTSTNATLATWDNITGINGTGITSNASTVVYDPAGTSAVPTTVQAKLRESVSVLDFGAVGDGVTDDTAAIQAALDSLTTTLRVYFPRGTYKISSTLLVGSQRFLYGENNAIDTTQLGNTANGTCIFPVAGFTDYLMAQKAEYLNPGSDTFWHNTKIENIYFRGNVADNRVSKGINCGSFGINSHLKDVYLINLDVGLRVGSSSLLYSGQYSCSMDGIGVVNCNQGVRFENTYYSAGINNFVAEICNIPVYLYHTKQEFHLAIDQIHGEGFELGTSFVLMDDCEGSFVDLRNATIATVTAPSNYELIRVNNTTVGHPTVKVKLSGVFLTGATTQYYLNDTYRGVQYTKDIFNEPYVHLSYGSQTMHNADGGYGTVVEGRSFKRTALLPNSTDAGKYVIESSTNDKAHCFGQFDGGIAAGVQIVKAGSPYTPYGQFRSISSLTEFNLFNTAGVFSPTVQITGGFIAQTGVAFEAGTREASGNTNLWAGGAPKFRVEASGSIRPYNDNVWTCGTASGRWALIYAGSGTINTSDSREKQQIEILSDAERRVAIKVKGLLRKFKFNDSVAAKGELARTHFGVMAQDVKLAFESEGLDPFKYAMLCYDEWPEQEAMVDANGVVTEPAVEAGNRYGVRYEELLAFVVAAL
jgi:hypothetical protein